LNCCDVTDGAFISSHRLIIHSLSLNLHCVLVYPSMFFSLLSGRTIRIVITGFPSNQNSFLANLKDDLVQLWKVNGTRVVIVSLQQSADGNDVIVIVTVSPPVDPGEPESEVLVRQLETDVERGVLGGFPILRGITTVECLDCGNFIGFV